jgi:hypothetical protein
MGLLAGTCLRIYRTILIMLIMPGTYPLPGEEKSPGTYSLEEILEIPKLIQILETPTT